MSNLLDKKVLYTYSSNHIKMSDELMGIYKEGLVFDLSRKSIYAQQQEFGYISDLAAGIRVSELGPNSYLKLDINSGYVDFYNTNSNGSIGSNLYITKITYADLYALYTQGNLIQNHYYEITDYVTTSSLNYTGIDNHYFNLIVKADTPEKLNCKARAKLRESDSTSVNYFSASDLSKWEIWYDINNDQTKYEWADTNGKGVIYRMIDEFGNDLNYDFKNIYFLSSNLDTNAKSVININNDSSHIYTFSGGSNIDLSLNGQRVNKVVISNFSLDSNDNLKYKLNKIIFRINNNTKITNIKVVNCNNLYFNYNTISYNNEFINCNNIYIGLKEGNINGENILNNLFINSDNLYTSKSIINNKVINSNNININRSNNIIENSTYCSVMGYNNKIVNSTYIFENYDNTISNVSYNLLNYCNTFTLGTSIDNIQKVSAIYSNNITFNKSFVENVIIENNNNITLNSSKTTSSTNKIKNIKLCSGLTNKTISIPEINNDYEIEYKPNTTREYII